ncbi:hypothetical protein C0J27_04720 [Candidatus Chromulinivorax destructor]|uniref:Uncharacterized protein n=2 Tax=Candidatus Chromulinivorax destructor TaxID=2066483 RepID=A0A345ZCJ0_9BACT|nr:hypothetical protein C0J27_04720 [Candidatus Chromulinivorax destructor]
MYVQQGFSLLAVLVACMALFFVVRLWKTEVVMSDEVQLIQLPSRAACKNLLVQASLDQIAEKTTLLKSLYGTKLPHEKAEPLSLDDFIEKVNRAYEEYAANEGYDAIRVRLVSKSKPLLYEVLLENYPDALDELRVRKIIS